tara:strand:+ start:460 stop:1005 length:546 start_codon:yes stop_codon:yes gene_type:complete
MNTKSQENSLFKNQILKWGIILLILFSLIFIFKNTLFKSSLALKSYGAISMDPEEAFHNNKPTFLEFYADWCEVCQEMAPSIISLRSDYQSDINFVFLNVDNSKWENYVKQYKINGIPEIILFNDDAEQKATFIGLKDEKLINDSLKKLLKNDIDLKDFDLKNFSQIQLRKNDNINPRSHA